MRQIFTFFLLEMLFLQTAHSQSASSGETPTDSFYIQSLAKTKLPPLSRLRTNTVNPVAPAGALQSPDTLIPPPPLLTFSGNADVYYRYDFAKNAANDLTSFTHSHNQFQLGMVSFKIEHKTDKVDLVADLGVGPRQQEFAYNDKGIAQAIKQLYISYSITDWLKVTGGTWVTHLCIESLDAPSNRNYSMSYLFTNGPFSHTGVKAEFSSGNNGLMIGVANPTDYRSIPDSGHANKNIIAQYNYIKGDDFKLYLSYVGGRDIADNRVHQYDLVASVKASSLFSFGLNTSVNRSSLSLEKYSQSRTWWGSALYVDVDPKPWMGFCLRTEYFSDPDGVKLPAPANIFATTLSLNLKAHGFTLIPEWRLDCASAPVFSHSDGSAAHSAGSFLLAAVYAF